MVRPASHPLEARPSPHPTPVAESPGYPFSAGAGCGMAPTDPQAHAPRVEASSPSSPHSLPQGRGWHPAWSPSSGGEGGHGGTHMFSLGAPPPSHPQTWAPPATTTVFSSLEGGSVEMELPGVVPQPRPGGRREGTCWPPHPTQGNRTAEEGRCWRLTSPRSSQTAVLVVTSTRGCHSDPVTHFG